MKPELNFSEAVRKGTRLAIWRDGKVLEVTPEELDALNRDSTPLPSA